MTPAYLIKPKYLDDIGVKCDFCISKEGITRSYIGQNINFGWWACSRPICQERLGYSKAYYVIDKEHLYDIFLKDLMLGDTLKIKRNNGNIETDWKYTLGYVDDDTVVIEIYKGDLIKYVTYESILSWNK